jgi:hypothetical protein
MAEEDNNKEMRKSIEEELTFSSSDGTYHQWLVVLSLRINELIQNDFAKLVLILYRLDVSESKLKILLKEYPDADAATIIAELIIERQLQKIKTRQTFRGDDTFIDENEKW